MSRNNLLDGYVALNGPIVLKDNNGMEYSIQYYQKKHKNEYVIKNGLGYCYLYKNGLLKMIWKEGNDGGSISEFASFDKGRISFVQDFTNLLNGNEWIRIINDKRGECMEIWKGDKVVYRGDYNNMYGREGMGIVYNEENGDIEYEGIFKNNILVRICKIFEGNEMMEFVDNGNNVDVVNQIPIYVGGYIVDENDGLFKRNGLGYLIDVDKRIATRECIYENGIELKGIDLIDGWYHLKYKHPVSIPISLTNSISTVLNNRKSISTPISTPKSKPIKPTSDLNIRINNSVELRSMNMNVTNLIISSNSCNELTSLNLNEYRYLKSIEIGNDCFENVDLFKIDGLKSLKSLKIGINSFTTAKNSYGNNVNRSFSILNCIELKLIAIGECSFSDYGGGFELRNLPKLSTIKIGEIGSWSYNFYYSSFVIKGIIDMILLMNRSFLFVFN